MGDSDHDIDLRDVDGRELVGPDGFAIGRVVQVYVDRETGRAEWAAVRLVGGDRGSIVDTTDEDDVRDSDAVAVRIVPLVEASVDGDAVRVPYVEQQVREAPLVDPDAGHVYRAQEADLYLHYGLPYDVATLVQDQTAGPREGASGQPLNGDEAMAGSTDGRDRHGVGEVADPDHEVRPGALDAATEHRQTAEEDATAGATGGATTIGTGPSGTRAGNAGMASAAGTNANTDLTQRTDLHTGDGRPISLGGAPVDPADHDAVRGSSMADPARKVTGPDDDEDRTAGGQ